MSRFLFRRRFSTFDSIWIGMANIELYIGHWGWWIVTIAVGSLIGVLCEDYFL